MQYTKTALRRFVHLRKALRDRKTAKRTSPKLYEVNKLSHYPTIQSVDGHNYIAANAHEWQQQSSFDEHAGEVVYEIPTRLACRK
jgi:hypothetical protein